MPIPEPELQQIERELADRWCSASPQEVADYATAKLSWLIQQTRRAQNPPRAFANVA